MQTSLSKVCDLHIHSTFSDSDATIEEIITQAQAIGLSCIAICDHDTLAGQSIAQRCGQDRGLEVLPAIEISAQNNDTEVHILGYLFDPTSPTLLEALSHIQETRKERISLMVEKLNTLGLAIERDALFYGIKDSIPTRLHLALHMVNKGYVKNMPEAFRKYLSPGKPAYVSRFKYTVEQVVSIIRGAGGLSFIAHPYMLPDQSWIEKFSAYGLDGLEVVYPRLTKEKIAFYERRADALGLLKSGGSDAHGSFKEYTKIGSVHIAYGWVEAMKRKAIEIKDHKRIS